MNQTSIGSYIARKRKEQNLTQEQLAEQLGVSNKTISKWENGKCMPDYSIIQKLCDTLHVTLPELMDGEDAAEDSVRVYDEAQILDLLRRTQELNGRRVFSMVFSLSFLVSPAAPCPGQLAELWGFLWQKCWRVSLLPGKSSYSSEAVQKIRRWLSQPCTDDGDRRTHKHSKGEALRLHPCCCFVVHFSCSGQPASPAVQRKKSGPFCWNRTSDTLSSKSAWADGSSKGSRNSSCIRRIR